MTTDLGDISLGGVKYRVDLTSYKEKDLADFSPRASVPGGSVNMAELLLYQPLSMTDWRHGFGFLWHTDAMGYMRSYGDIDTRQPGAVMMASTKTDISDTADPQKGGLVLFTTSNVIYSWSAGTTYGVRKFSWSTGWSDVWKPGTSAILTCFATADYLFMSQYNTRLQKLTTAGVQSDAGYDANSKSWKQFCLHNGKIYAYQTGSNILHWSSDPELDDLEGNLDSDSDGIDDDPTHVVVGAGKHSIIGMVSYANYLYVFRADGVWVVGDDDIARRVLDFSSETGGSLNYALRAIYNGYLYFNVGPNIYQWNGARLTDVTPPRLGDRYPYSEVRYYGGGVKAGNYLYVLAEYFDDEAGSTATDSIVCLLSFDGVGWHKLNDIRIGTTYASVIYDPIIFDPSSPRRLIINVDQSTYAINQPYRNVPVSPFAAGLSSDTAPYLKSPRLDMGFRRVQKSVPSILVEADNLSTVSTESRYLVVDYYVDGSTTIESFGSVTANGITELFPNQQDASPAPTQEFKNMVLMVRFVNAGALTTQTPILEGLTVRFLMRPDVFYGYSFGIVVAENYLYGTEQASTSAKDLRDALLTLRDSKAPIEFIDIYGDTHDVYISSVSLQAQERHENSEDGTNNIESIIVVNLVEAA